MATNFYYTVEGSEPIHIGKTTTIFSMTGFQTFYGGVSHTLAELTEALMQPGVAIEDEYGTPMTVEKFVDEFLDGFSNGFAAYQLGWLHGSRTPIDRDYDENSSSNYWHDPASGALFSNHTFH